MPEPGMSAGGKQDQTRSGNLFCGISRAARGAVEIVLRTDRQLRSRYPLQVPSGCRGCDAGIVPLRCALGKEQRGATWLLPQSVMRAAARAADAALWQISATSGWCRRPASSPAGGDSTTRSRAGYYFAPRTLSWINPAIRARVSIAINENSAGVFRTIGLASVNRVRA